MGRGGRGKRGEGLVTTGLFRVFRAKGFGKAHDPISGEDDDRLA